MDNIVNLFPKETKTPHAYDLAMEYVQNNLIPWLEQQGVNTCDPNFKYQGATILACIQGMLINV